MHGHRPQRAYPGAGGDGSGAGTGPWASPHGSTWSPASTTSTPGPMRAVRAGEWVPVAGTPAEANLVSPDSGARGRARLITARCQPHAQRPDAATAHCPAGAQAGQHPLRPGLGCSCSASLQRHRHSHRHCLWGPGAQAAPPPERGPHPHFPPTCGSPALPAAPGAGAVCPRHSSGGASEGEAVLISQQCVKKGLERTAAPGANPEMPLLRLCPVQRRRDRTFVVPPS